MKKPLERGAAINPQRYKRWLATFSGYHDPVTQPLVELWLEQFGETDRDLAARVLDAVHFVTFQNMQTSFREILTGLPGWHRDPSKRSGRWYFVPFSGSSGESGDRMVHEFRVANGLTAKQFSSSFIYRSELVSLNLTPADTVLLIDDFAGTGKQASDAWRDTFAELLAGKPRVFLVLVAATNAAIKRTHDETEMEVLCRTRFSPSDNVFERACSHFTEREKRALLDYCKVADPKRPRGWGECGLLVVLAHRCPNNAIAILHSVHSKWTGLFPRHL